jgi:AraC family transcriptional regulator, regulatory protein of adaptative response / methylated-DNA-[protein]-cysteine methyltransferase
MVPAFRREFERKVSVVRSASRGDFASMMTPQPMTDDERWTAFAERDRSFDGAFVMGVRTTGVYCRPSCPARRPHRHNTQFFDTPAEAEREGFRPCKRCRPHAADGAPIERSVQAARAYLDARVGQRVPLARLGRAVGLSPWHVQRAFTRLVGVSPKAYQEARQRERFKDGLRRGETVSRAAADAGRSAEIGMSPGKYRRGGRGETIRYAVVPSALGFLLVGTTDRGVASVMLDDSAKKLEAIFRGEFPEATLVRDDAGVEATATAIVDSIERGNGLAALPVDLRGTAFQMRVWAALREIPAGATRTYAEVAQSIGQPKAVRAVAGACAANPVAIVVPCHRVVRSDGGEGGYRWGEDRKRRLLATESTQR